jgi:formyltetrahydrofolate deformylase
LHIGLLDAFSTVNGGGWMHTNKIRVNSRAFADCARIRCLMSADTHRPTATLLLSGPDRKGLVASISGFLYQHGANILHADQHADSSVGMFFQRIQFELDGMDLGFAELEEAIGPLIQELGMQFQLLSSEQRKRVAVLASKSDHCLLDVLLRARAGELNADFVLVASNHEDHRAMVAALGLPYYVFPMTPETKAGQEKDLLELLRRERTDLVILARYMQILGREFVGAFPHRIINIHHSFLPAFSGARPYHQAYERGVKLIGATSHYVTEELDAGPIIEQETVRVSHRDSIEDLQRKGRDLEKLVLARAVRTHLEDRVLVYANKTVVFD